MRYFLIFISLVFMNFPSNAQNNLTFKTPTEYSIDSLAKLLKIKYYKDERGEEYWFNDKGQRTQKNE